MFKHRILQNLDEYFLNLNRRGGNYVFFYRFNGLNREVIQFLKRYYETARLNGVILEGKIPNPEDSNLDYYYEIMGNDFQLSMGFLINSLKKWLPRMNGYQLEAVSAAIYDTLDYMRIEGKNDNMLKNAYVKYMCWLYYKFERIVSRLGSEQIPKILYEGEISNYELKLISILSNAGCDVVLLQHQGDSSYLQTDKDSRLSDAYPMTGLSPFPKSFSISKFQEEIEEDRQVERMYGQLPELTACTNKWTEKKGLEDVLKGVMARGSEPLTFYNCYLRINGVEDKLTYLNELYQFYLQLKSTKRDLVIINHKIKIPDMDEISLIKRSNYSSVKQMLGDLSGNIKYPANHELQKLIKKAFLDVMLETNKNSDYSLNKMTNQAIYILCWLNRYIPKLFPCWTPPMAACFIYLGGIKNENEVLFVKILSRIPADVLILNPNRNIRCALEDEMLYEISHEESMEVEEFPCVSGDIRMGTAAYHAERELDGLLYQDTGLYRDYQYRKGNSVILRTMYEEISILWDQELKYRPNFGVVNDQVTLPVIFARISGVKDGPVSAYWSDIKRLKTEDTLLIKKTPFLNPVDFNPIKQYATEFLKNGRVQRNRIKTHKAYTYAFLREEVQEYLLDKFQLLLDQRIIKGTFENGTEYTIASVVLNLNHEILRLIQKFDFTKKNPKVIFINTTETIFSLEDSILMAFLNLLGFDIIIFIPTGYQTVEKYFTNKIMEEHQIGEYRYELEPPDFDTVLSNSSQPWHHRIFRRGN